MVAKVGDRFLYLDDISSLLTSSFTYDDSIEIIQNYTDKWIKEQLVIQKAKINLTEDQQDFNDQLEDYKNSLLIYTFEEKLIEQKLDTSISETDIEIFYVYNKENFELKESIVRCKFMKVPVNAPNVDKVDEMISSNKNEDKILLNEYCVQFAEVCSIDTLNWVSFDNLVAQLPIRIDNPQHFLKNNKNYQVEDSLYKYYLKILDYKIKSSISPKSFVREKIKTIILNQRRIKLIHQIKKEIFEEGTLEKRYEVYIPKNNEKI